MLLIGIFLHNKFLFTKFSEPNRVYSDLSIYKLIVYKIKFYK